MGKRRGFTWVWVILTRMPHGVFEQQQPLFHVRAGVELVLELHDLALTGVHVTDLEIRLEGHLDRKGRPPHKMSHHHHQLQLVLGFASGFDLSRCGMSLHLSSAVDSR